MLKEEPVPTFSSPNLTPIETKSTLSDGAKVSEADGTTNMTLPVNLNVSSPVVKEWLSKRRENIRPWSLFLSTTNFAKPATIPKLTKRVYKNLDHFQSNYVFVFIILFLFCLLTSPMLLIVMAACGGACYILKIKQAEKKFQLGGKEIGLPQQYGIVAICSIPLFLLAGAGSAVFWVIGASFFVIGLHASFFNYDSIEMDDQEGLTGSIVEEV